MEKFLQLQAVAVPMAAPDIDTDQIIPARFLRKPRSEGLASYLFHDLRFAPDGGEQPDFVLNHPAWRAARILVANTNFGCGSSREYAVNALMDFGFRAVIAPGFGDIFRNNALTNGLVAITLPEADVAALREALAAQPGATMAIDLAAQTVTAPDGRQHAFAIDPFRKRCLIEGVDELDVTLSERETIAAFERAQAAETPWV
jgi:3-isopropylmalate/(R)-2-methylmalate dehydratase small subunit